MVWYLCTIKQDSLLLSEPSNNPLGIRQIQFKLPVLNLYHVARLYLVIPLLSIFRNLILQYTLRGIVGSQR